MGLFSFISDLFKPKQKTTQVQPVADPYGGVRGGVNKFLEGGLQDINSKELYKASPYPNEMVAPMSDQENQSLGYLDQYAKGTPSKTFQLGSEEINKTLSGDYDPATSPYYQAVKAEAARNLEETQKNIASNAAGAGRYWSGARLKEQGNAAMDVNNQLNTLLGQLSQQERQNRLSVLPQAAQFAQQEEEAPLRKATALQQLGTLPRAIQQAIDQAGYSDWLRTNVDQPFSTMQLASGTQSAPLYSQVGYSPSTFSQIMGAIPNITSGLSSLADLFKK